ncbi:hypothetical protein [Streptomyces sp. NPDC056785]|uniref:hypothetical protein n=1 Tax=Streptomyces sp. NPDC056785 TaxID=3345944 RepID=UPI003675CCF7
MSTTRKHPINTQEPEPVRPWFARLFRRRPTPAQIARANLRAADPAGAFASGMRQAEALRTAREDAERWKQHADSFERDLRQAVDDLADRTRERDYAQEDSAQLLAWISALHPATAVTTPMYDGRDSQELYLVADGWQMRWIVLAEHVGLFQHVPAVEVTDPRAQWDGHGEVQRGERIRNHVRLLALSAIGDGSSTAVITGPEAHSA